MGAPGVRVDGLKLLTRNLRAIDKGYPKELKSIHLAVAKPVAPRAARMVRSRTGTLANTVKAMATQREGRVQAGGGKAREYAAINHYGGYPGAYSGNPFLERAVYDSNAQIVRDFTSLTDAFIERVWVDT